MHPAASTSVSSEYPQKQMSSVPILKVMRLQSPEFGQPSAGSLDGKGLLNSMLTLPDSFGVIHVGETFTAYLGVLNVSCDLMVTNLSVTAALQTPSRRFTLSSNLDENNNKGGMTIAPAKGVDAIVSRALEEVGQHILRVEVGYGDTNKSIRKFYRFNVANPLHIRELTMRAGDASCFVSIAIENVTANSSLTTSGADFHPPHGLTSQMIGGPKCSGELIQEQLKSEHNSSSNVSPLSALTLFDNCGRLDPGESFRYLFLIKASSQDAKLRGIAAGDELGKAIFTWKKSMGEAGRIASAAVLCPPTTPATSTLSTSSNTKFVVHGSGLSVDVAAAAANRYTSSTSTTSTNGIPTNSDNYETTSLDEVLPVTVEPIDPPSTMELGIPTQIQLLVVNHTEKEMNLQLQLRPQHMSGVVVCGSSSTNLGLVQPSGGSSVVRVNLVPLVAGLFRVQGCWIVDLITGREIEQPPLFHVFVQKDYVDAVTTTAAVADQ